MLRRSLLCLLAFLLSACGQQGSLYLPPDGDQDKDTIVAHRVGAQQQAIGCLGRAEDVDKNKNSPSNIIRL